MQTFKLTQTGLYLMVVFIFRVLCVSNSINKTESSTRRNIQCDELPSMLLADLLGEAYNARYMSINWPISSEEVISANTRNDQESHNRKGTNYQKRRTDEQPSFYVDEFFADEISDKPAWDVRHKINIESKKKRRRRRAVRTISRVSTQQEGTQQSSDEDEGASGRQRRAVGRPSHNDNFNKTYLPWKCDSYLRWIDLGPDYFPRYLRTVECVKHFCWYKAFVCKAKSFAVKILKRKRGLCADTSNLKKISAYDFRGDLGEVWQWEEVAVNFCCDCALA